MRVINSNEQYKIYTNHVKIYNDLPSKIYTVAFNEMEGFSLLETNDFTITDTKIYGVHLAKVEKVLNGYAAFERNLGIILSGDKGIGKSLFARLLCIQSVERGLPVIIVDRFIPGINNFIDSIDQEVVVLFDEFDKTFRDNNMQATMLSLFDGLSSNKKLFVVTCNNVFKLNDFLVNRPGRFHYHFRFEYPTFDEIEEYLKDKLAEKFWGEIPNVIKFSSKINLNYDCLRAITYELSNGLSFKEAIRDLNILNTEEQYYNVIFEFSDGGVINWNYKEIDLFDTRDKIKWWIDEKNFNVEFLTKNLKYDNTQRCYIVENKDVSIMLNGKPYARALKDGDVSDTAEVNDLSVKITIKRTGTEMQHYLV